MKDLLKNIPEPLQEAIKELGRVILFAIIPLLISYLEQGTGVDYRALAIVGSVAGLRFIDKFIHETGKELEEKKTVASPLTGGLSRF
jgi:hypothetical protein